MLSFGILVVVKRFFLINLICELESKLDEAFVSMSLHTSEIFWLI